ncbi:FAD-dependent oxidoreductase [Pectinatus frisingensis]|uniref:FAD-dependent oxidoreductase n=1 Tax=Pectinatus frisingensis TaxID=865 RepID=UPI0018C4683D|nr:FAD-dependent oxidoreductase [Pectinatus frisingensis]
MKTVIIGGVAGGATTAARLRRRDESMEIVVLEKGGYISYANCGLPYYIGNVIKEREKLLVQTPEGMKNKFNVDVRIFNEAEKILPDKRCVLVKDLQTGAKYEESYDKLVIATGSSPLRPPIKGIDAKKIMTLWSVDDTDKIKKTIDELQPKRAVVVGGGFIGLEMAENLHKKGIHVTIIEALDQVMAPLDKEMAQLLHENIIDNDVELFLGDKVTEFEEKNEAVLIHLSSGKKVPADVVILSIGVRPNSFLARDAGLKLNQRGGIVVNNKLQTSDENIYAVGDVIEVENPLTGDKTMIPLAGPANKQARICADNIVGDDKIYQGTYGTAIAQVFDLDAASVGLNEKTLKFNGKKKNSDYYTVVINQKSHAGYYPDAADLYMKLIFTAEGKILGAQIVGQSGVDKRIDTLAAVMQMNGDIYDLQRMEFAYAPPFSAAKDPINMMGFVAENILTGLVSFISVEEFDNSQNDNITILDIREDIEFMVYHLPDAYHIPLGQLRSRFTELDKHKTIIVYCAVGVRSYNAARILMQNGFEHVMVLEGGTNFYKAVHFQDKQKDDLKPTASEQPAATDKSANMKIVDEFNIQALDCNGLQCPGPILKVNQAVRKMNDGEVIKVSATDMGFIRDIRAWCEKTGNTLVKTDKTGHQYIAYVGKGVNSAAIQSSHVSKDSSMAVGKTMVVFSDDLDRAMASLVIANGAAAMGRPVTMFFTFWGLNILRKNNAPAVKKSFIAKMFGSMMPRGTENLTISKMNMGGIGTKMMKKIMKDKNVASLDELLKSARENGVKMIACTMSMDVMGITKEELIDGIDFGGVTSYLGAAEEANVNLFI